MLNRIRLTAVALGCSLVSIATGAAVPIPYPTTQVISNGDSDAVIAVKRRRFHRAPIPTVEP